jgi:hypothetical protein
MAARNMYRIEINIHVKLWVKLVIYKKKKIGDFVTLYQRELLKKIPHLGTFCTQTVNEELKSNTNAEQRP